MMADNFRGPGEIEEETARSFDSYAHAVTVISEEHRMIHDGFFFFRVHAEDGIPDGTSRNTLLRTGATPVHLKGIRIDASEGPVNVVLTENATITTLGVELDTVNANRLSSNESLMKMYDNTTVIADVGSPVLGGLYVPQNGSNGVTGSTTIEELILLPNTDYVLNWENDPAGQGTADVKVVIAWYEIGYENR